MIASWSSSSIELLGSFGPVDYVPDSREEFDLDILVLQIVSVFPGIKSKQRSQVSTWSFVVVN